MAHTPLLTHLQHLSEVQCPKYFNQAEIFWFFSQFRKIVTAMLVAKI